jgi:hypothetical protein
MLYALVVYYTRYTSFHTVLNFIILTSGAQLQFMKLFVLHFHVTHYFMEINVKKLR